MTVGIEDIRIRHELAPGDLGCILYLHGWYYRREHGYGLQFESYVAQGLHEFVQGYDPERDRVWICNHDQRVVGSLILMHRGDAAAQLRYFLVIPAYRGIGLGKHLMAQFMAALVEGGYRSAFLWTTDELPAAAALYRRHGFSLSEEKESLEFGSPVRAQRYDLSLPRP